jgi:multimeric flavodoxin WrbA
MKALIDRTGYVSRANGRMFKRKVGASVVAVRRSGAIHALDTMDHFFLSGEMVIVGRALASSRAKERWKGRRGMETREIAPGSGWHGCSKNCTVKG